MAATGKLLVTRKILRGVKYVDLISILDCMYLWEVNVAQEELNSFLAVAEDLKVKGLTQGNGENKQKGLFRPESPRLCTLNTPQRKEPPSSKHSQPLHPVSRAPSLTPRAPLRDYVLDEDEIQEVLPVKTDTQTHSPISGHLEEVLHRHLNPIL